MQVLSDTLMSPKQYCCLREQFKKKLNMHIHMHKKSIFE